MFLYLVVSWGQTDRKLNNLEPPLKYLGRELLHLCVCRNGLICRVCSPGALRAHSGQDRNGKRAGEKSRGESALRGVRFPVLVTE